MAGEIEIVKADLAKFEYGERFQKCTFCGTLRPRVELMRSPDDGEIICKDAKWCASEAIRQISEAAKR